VRVDPNYLLNLSSSLDQSTAVEAQLTNELSSGLRVSSLSVDPTAAAQSSLLNTEISQQDTYVQVASGESSRLQVADSTLGEVVTQLTSAISLAVQGGNGTLNASNQSSVAQQLTAIRDTVLGLANTSYSGTYLFQRKSGDDEAVLSRYEYRSSDGDVCGRLHGAVGGDADWAVDPGEPAGVGRLYRCTRGVEPVDRGLLQHERQHIGGGGHPGADGCAGRSIDSAVGSGQFVEQTAIDQHLRADAAGEPDNRAGLAGGV